MVKNRLTAEEKKQIEECKRRENEVKALFDEHDEVYGKKRYMAKVPELLRFLKYKKNAKTFWENPHIKMIYNISDHNNFLLSIYTEETDIKKYEKWLREHFSNPFFNKSIVNIDLIQNDLKINNSNKLDLYDFLTNLINARNHISKYEILEKDWMLGYEYIVHNKHIMKFIPVSELLDRDYYQSLQELHPKLPEYVEHGHKRLKTANTYIERIRLQLSNKDTDSRAFFSNFESLRFALGDACHLFSKGSSSERINSILNELSDEFHVFTDELMEDNLTYEMLEKHLNTLTSIYDNIVVESEIVTRQLPNFANIRLILHPLIAMDNNFLRIDEYNIWKGTLAKQWSEVRKNNPDMLAILDALVKSRKNYLEEINK